MRNCGGDIRRTTNIRNSKLGPLIALASIAAAPVMAELPTSAQEMDDLVVTATRLATPRGEVASSVTVITAEDIERRQFRSVAHALRSVPGLHVVQSGGPGQQTSVFMRGANSNHTLVLIDGIEATDPSSPAGAVDFSNLWLDNIERIEIVRGPQSTLYGSDAIGGVIHITTRRGEGKLHGAGKLEGGSDNTVNQQASAAGSTDRVNYSVGVTHVDTDGDSVTPRRLRNGVSAEDDNYENWTTSARLGMAVSDRLEVTFFGRYIDSETDLDPELEMFGFGTTEDRDARLDQTEYLLRGEAKAQLLDGLWEATFSTSYSDFDRKNRNDRQSPTETLTRTTFDGDKLKFELKNDFYLMDAHVMTLGLETEKENMDSGGFSDFGGFIVGEETDADARNDAVYAQDQFSYGNRVFGTAGLRYDDHDGFGSEVTYRLAPVYVHRETNTRLKASVGTGFKAPTLFQTDGFTPNNFGSFYRGNPDLDPEESFGWEIGIEQAFWDERLNVGVTWFKSDIDDLMQVVFDPFFNSTYENIDEADIQGAETFIHVQPLESLAVRLDYTYTDAEDDDTGEQLLRRAKHKLDLDVEFRPLSRASINLAVNYVSDYKDISRESAGTIKGDDYAVLDIAADYQLNKQWRLFGRVENATDEHYEPADGFQASDRGLFAGAELKL
ncbi:MAG: TonB-dependent receptor [Pseudomonadota bacterium]|nr:TonB-dependent receptor [Pseudomonadota bacterium]